MTNFYLSSFSKIFLFFSSQFRIDLDALKKLGRVEEESKQERLEGKLGEQDFKFDRLECLEPITNTVKETKKEISRETGTQTLKHLFEKILKKNKAKTNAIQEFLE